MVRDLFVFYLGGHRLGLPLDRVIRVFQAVALLPLPGAPPVILGLVNIKGRLTPVIEIRRRFGLASKDISPSDHMVLLRSQQRELVITVDSSIGVIGCNVQDQLQAGEIDSRLPWLEAVARTIDGVVYVHDLERLLSLEEEGILQEALALSTAGLGSSS